MKQSDAKEPTADRRSFLKLAGASVVGGGAAVVASVTPASAAAEGAAPSADGGYRETEHVRRYYELAKFI